MPENHRPLHCGKRPGCGPDIAAISPLPAYLRADPNAVHPEEVRARTRLETSAAGGTLSAAVHRPGIQPKPTTSNG